MIYKPWDIATIPFPLTGAGRQNPRPILILSDQEFQEKNGHFTAAMITTAGGTIWHGDTPISNLESTGLSHPSIIRCKFFTLPVEASLKVIGMLDLADQKAFQLAWKQYQF